MKNSLLFFLTVFYSFSQNSAPSSHMLMNDDFSGDILVKTVRSTITTPSTYFCTMQWNAGREGGGYCGFQDSSSLGKVFIFSIWDPRASNQPITTNYVGDNTTVQKFGGEGTGLKSLNSAIGWNLNEWNTVVARRWDVGSRTHFGFWIRRGSQKKWYHMITMNYPVANVVFQGRTNAFLEDWSSTGRNKRRFEMKDAYTRKLDGSWFSASQIRYTRNNEGRSSNYTNRVDAGIVNDAFFMECGGNSTPSFSGTPPVNISVSYGSAPENPAIVFAISSISKNNISWNVPESSTPQYKYTIKVNGNTVSSSINSEKRSASISISNTDVVDVELEDILGKKTKISSSIEGLLSISDYENSKQNLEIFPNPSYDGVLNVNFTKTTNIEANIEVFNILGTKIFSSKTTSNKNKLDLSSLLKGVYVLKVNKFVKKVIIK